MKILHFIIRPYFYRCHHPFKNKEGVEHVFLGPNTRMPKWFKQPGRRIILYPTPHKPSSQLMNKIEAEKPDVILFSDYSTDLGVMKTLHERGYQLWLINHGVWCPGFLERRARVGEKNNVNLPYITRAFHTPVERQYFLDLGYSPEVFSETKSYIGLDLLENAKTDYDLNSLATKNGLNDKKSVLYITNKAGFKKNLVCNDNQTYKEYCQVLGILTKWTQQKNMILFSKMKMTRSLETRTRKFNGHNPEHVKVLPGWELIYPYLHLADIIVIQGYSTAYLEALYLNKPVIICQIPKNLDFQDLDNYPNLLKAYDAVNLTKLMDELCKNGVTNNELYQVDRKRYLAQYFSEPAESLVQRIEQEALKLGA